MCTADQSVRNGLPDPNPRARLARDLDDFTCKAIEIIEAINEEDLRIWFCDHRPQLGVANAAADTDRKNLDTVVA